MSLFLLLALLVGLALIVGGGDEFVDSACELARRLGVSRAVIGLTLVSFATTLPELATSAMAAAMGSGGVAYGNVVGSCIANIALVLSIAVVAVSIPIERDRLREGIAMLALAAAVVVMALDGGISRLEGLLLLLMLGLFLGFLVRRGRGAVEGELAPREGTPRPRELALRFSLGAAGIIVGSRLLIYAGVGIARWLGVPEAVIGFTLVAVGTSLPELTTAAVSAVKRVPELSLGNIIGANVLDLTWVLGFASALKPVAIGPAEVWFSNLMMLVVVASLLAFMLTGRRLSRWEGVALLALYGFYLAGLAVWH